MPQLSQANILGTHNVFLLFALLNTLEFTLREYHKYEYFARIQNYELPKRNCKPHLKKKGDNYKITMEKPLCLVIVVLKNLFPAKCS